MEDKAVLASGTGSMQWAVRHTEQPCSKWTQEIAMETWLKEREKESLLFKLEKQKIHCLSDAGKYRQAR